MKKENVVKKGNIIISKNPVYRNGYRVEDPAKTVNPFLALKMDKFGFLELDSRTKKVLESGIKISIKNLDILEELKSGISGNREGNISFHLDNIKNTLLKSEDVWIDINMLPHLSQLFKMISGDNELKESVDILIFDKFSFKNQYFQISLENLSSLLGIFGKFYFREMSSFENKRIGYFQEKLNRNQRLNLSEKKELKSIVDRIYSKIKSEQNLPPQNIFFKIKDILFYIDRL